MIRRHHYSILCALFLSSIVLAACGEKDSAPSDTSAPSLDGEHDGTDARVQEPLDPPQQAQIPDAPPGTATVEDARMANDVLLKLVADREIDAQHFAVRVDKGIVTLLAAADASEDERERAVARANDVRNVQEVRIEQAGGAIPDSVPSEEAQDVLDVVENAQRDEDETDDVEALEPSEDEEAPLEALAAIGEPAPMPEEDEPEDAPVAEDDTPEADVPGVQGEESAYTVKRGDSLSGIAARELGSGGRWMELYERNKSVIGSNPDGLREGMVLTLPPK